MTSCAAAAEERRMRQQRKAETKTIEKREDACACVA